MSFMTVAVGVVGEGIGAAMLAGGMMGGATTFGMNILSGRDAFSNMGQGMLMGAAGSGLVSGLGSLAGGVGTTTTSTIAGDMATPSYSEWEKTQALLDTAPTASSNVVTNTIAPIETPLPPAASELADNGYRNAGDYNADATSEIPLAPNPPTTSTAGSPPDLKANPTTGMLPNNTTTTTRPPAEFMKNPADYMVQNPSKVAGVGMGLNSLLNPQQRGIANPIKGPGGNNYNYPYQPAQYDSSGRTIKPASYGNPAITHYAAAGGAIKHYASGSQVDADAANMYSNSSGKGPYNDSNPIYGSEDGPMYTDKSKYANLAKELNKLTPTQLAAAAADDTDPIENAEAEKLLRIKTARRLGAYKPRRAAAQSDTTNMAQGGIASLNTYAAGGKLLQGPGDGMSDSIPAVIQGARPQRAALAQGEFVVPADVVSHLGNGSTDAGAKRLYAMMDKIRHARTGNKKQGKQINPNNFLPT